MIYNHIGKGNKEDEIGNIEDDNVVDVNKSDNMSL